MIGVWLCNNGFEQVAGGIPAVEGWCACRRACTGAQVLGLLLRCAYDEARGADVGDCVCTFVIGLQE